ncbi:CopG family ribbon-helix-helix protein [Methylocystis sp. JAN1]|uniref:CopG family ribbon-helix-helix protein n=1 Tax=Methylocystis sp. JAN1 TaxID=3397211 RepID=UPI003FA32FCC
MSKLDLLAKKLDRSPALVATQAIEDFVRLEEWRVREIEAGLADAEAGDFASPEDVARIMARFAARTS